MPVKITKLKSGRYRVSTPSGVKSKGTTLKKAKAQKRLINMKEAGVVPTGGWRK